jgi:hypothetical protein
VTCIVGLEHAGHVWLAGDSAATGDDDSQCLCREPKVRRQGAVVWGQSGSVRLGDVLTYQIDWPERAPKDPEKWIRVELPRMLRAHESDIADDDLVLVGLAGRLFMIDDEFGACRDRAPYAAIGVAGPALGALYATRRKLFNPRTRLRTALEACASCCSTVKPPWTFVTV